MNAVLILEDLQTLARRSKSLKLAQKICRARPREANAVWLYDGLTCARLKKDGQLGKAAFDKRRRPAAAVFGQWAAKKFANSKVLCLIVDLKFGKDDMYGYEVFRFLSAHFSGEVEPVVYSRWVSDDNRSAMARTFGVPGKRILQRDTDDIDKVVALLDQLLP